MFKCNKLILDDCIIITFDFNALFVRDGRYVGGDYEVVSGEKDYHQLTFIKEKERFVDRLCKKYYGTDGTYPAKIYSEVKIKNITKDIYFGFKLIGPLVAKTESSIHVFNVPRIVYDRWKDVLATDLVIVKKLPPKEKLLQDKQFFEKRLVEIDKELEALSE